ncbi:MAG: HEAT repeat domain-containing protein, partial [Gemmatimonadota bacterium]|nr:HEAT repeat domain-containing protein [Gemmatimonadota bacterium]
PAETLEELKGRYESGDPAWRLEAVRRIAIDHTAEGLSVLIRAADDRDEYVRERAVQALGASDDKKVVTALKVCLKDSDRFVRWRAVQAIGRLGVRDNIAGSIIPLLEDEFWRVKVSALELLGNIGAEQAGSSLDEPVKTALVQKLEDRDERVRLAAAEGLAHSRDNAALKPLLDLLQNGSMFTRASAAVALGALGDKSSVEPLIEAMADPRNRLCDEGRDWVIGAAAKALYTLTGENFRESAGRWREWYDSNK